MNDKRKWLSMRRLVAPLRSVLDWLRIAGGVEGKRYCCGVAFDRRAEDR